MIINEIKKLIDSDPYIDIGFSPVGYCMLPNHYKSAIIMVTRHTEIITLQNYSEDIFEKILCETRDHSRNILVKMKELLKNNNIAYYIPQEAQANEKDLCVPFSYKFGAVNAGMGWIGKNGVLVSRGFGPRVRIDAIITDINIPAVEPVKGSFCDINCNKCIEVCPYGALKNNLWKYGMHRNELIDYKLCNQKRSEFISLKNRKNSCGLCIVSCPLGI
ncbi:MAG: hypothetical protein LBL73_03350 [Synergistaceae bacterium]|nr:hypothetical protein [Synergistaceae bacterium]